MVVCELHARGTRTPVIGMHNIHFYLYSTCKIRRTTYTTIVLHSIASCTRPGSYSWSQTTLYSTMHTHDIVCRCTNVTLDFSPRWDFISSSMVTIVKIWGQLDIKGSVYRDWWTCSFDNQYCSPFICMNNVCVGTYIQLILDQVVRFQGWW